MIAYLVALILAWSYVCYVSGEIAATRRMLKAQRRKYADDMNARDAWATATEKRMKN